MPGVNLDEQVVDNVPAIENTRVLVGFMRQSVAVERMLNAHTLRNPVLTKKEMDRIREEKEEEFRENWHEANSSVVGSPNWLSGSVDLEPFPSTPEIESHLEKFMSQEHFQQLVSDIPEDQWGFRLVPLESIVAFQPSVTTTGHSDISTSEEGWIDVIEDCLPVRGNKYVMEQARQNPDRVGFELISRGPNIDLAAANLKRDVENDTININFQIKPRINIVQVVYFANRYILKNGYHRSFQLINAGETKIPALVREANSYDETGGAQPEMLSQELVLGERPPLVSDFLTGAAVDIDGAGFNKVIRIFAETTNIRR